MLTKFQNQSNRVKGLAFHPKRPWILAALHNGVIQLWDYRMETLIDTFEEHDGPVRGISFHATQPLFVSGGDDYKIKVWNYQLKRCLFNLLGHLDYIRTVQFHTEYPWVLSASDDQTLRIWNWQSRQCLAVLTGHNHYVMCGQFHPREDLVLSASLDQTVRVWDIAGLRKKNVSITPDFSQGGGPPGMNNQANAANDLFGGSDVLLKHVLEGHTRGVNWASFHRTMPLIVSGADDREVKLWRMNEAKAWEVDTMRGHVGNVSCVIFHPREELIVSNSEDKSIRVWDISKHNPPIVLRRENDRYWILDAHPNLNLIAAGHDSGLLVFKLSRERPPFHAQRKSLFFYKDNYIRQYDFKTGKDAPLLSTRRHGKGKNRKPRTLLYNTANRQQHCMLLCSDADGGSYELYVLPKSSGSMTTSESASQSARGTGRAAVFVSRNRFAVLNKQRQVVLRDMKNELRKKLNLGKLYITGLFEGGMGRLLIRASDSMVLYDIQVMKVVARMPITSRHPVKYVAWSHNHKHCAMWSKANIYLTNSQLEESTSITETSRVKSGAWDSSGVFVYTTATHIKYLLPNGDSGILRTLDTPIYITRVAGSQIHYLDRNVQTGVLEVDTTEYQFKINLVKRRYKEVWRIMKTNRLVGQSIIAYLQKKGFPEVALHFVKDMKTRLSLALECGNIRVALEAAQQLDDSESWYKLGVAALRQGNHQVVEAAYQKTKNFDRLSFLYLMTGNTDKLEKMLHIALLRGDLMGRFHNALYLGNVEERVKVLRESGQTKLAKLTAHIYGVAMPQNEEEDAKKEDDEEDEEEFMAPEELQRLKEQSRLLFPPNPILRDANWPLLEVSPGYFDPAKEGKESSDDEEDEEDVDDEFDDDLGADDQFKAQNPDDIDLSDFGFADDEEKSKQQQQAAGDGFGADLDDLGADLGIDLDLGGLGGDDAAAASGSDSSFTMPQAGPSTAQRWADNAQSAADLVAAGSFDLAQHMLNRQLGIVNFAALRPAFMRIHNAAQVTFPVLSGCGSLSTSLEREPDKPVVGVRLPACVEQFKEATKLVTGGKITEALEAFRLVLAMLPLVNTDDRESAEVRDLIKITREYITAMRLEAARRGAEGNPARQCELAAYFTHCKLQPVHVILGLKVAIKAAFGIKNFQMAASFCRRILEFVMAAPNKAVVEKVVKVPQIKGVLAHCEKQGATDQTKLNYRVNVAFRVCGRSLTPVWKGDPVTMCPYCNTAFKQEFDLSLCDNCSLAKIGTQTSSSR